MPRKPKTAAEAPTALPSIPDELLSHFDRHHGRLRTSPSNCLVASPRRSRWPPPPPNETPWFAMQTHPRRTQCGVGAEEPFVTHAECARARIPDAPLPLLRGGPA